MCVLIETKNTVRLLALCFKEYKDGVLNKYGCYNHRMPNPRLTTAIKAVQKSSEYLVEQFHSRHQVSMKKDDTVLLGEDLKSEQMLMSAISKAFPSDTFLT